MQGIFRRFAGCIQNSPQGLDLHDKIALSVLQAVPEGHRGKDPVKRPTIAACRGNTDRLRQKGTQGGCLEESGFAGGIGARQKDRTDCRDTVADCLFEQGMIEVLHREITAVVKNRHCIGRECLPPGRDADTGIDPACDRKQGIDLILPAPHLLQHTVELDQVQMKQDPDILHDKAEGVRVASFISQKKGGASPKAGESIEQGGDLIGFLSEHGALAPFFFQRSGAVQQSKDVVENLEIRCYDRLFLKISAQVPCKNDQQGNNADACVRKHQAKSRKGSCGGNIVRHIAALAQGRREINIIIERISPCMAKSRQDLLQADPGLLICDVGKPVVLIPVESQFICTHGRGPQYMVEIFLTGSAAGTVDHTKDLFKVQIVPCDVIDLKSLPVVLMIPWNLGIAFRRCFFDRRAAELFFEFCSQFAACPFALLTSEYQCDDDKGCQNSRECQGRMKVSHICLCLLLDDLLHNMVLVFVDMPGGNCAADHGKRIDIGVRADNAARIEDRITADIHPVAKDGTDLAKAGGCVRAVAVDHDVLLVRLDIGCDGACAHMCMETKDAVADIIVVGNFYLVEENDIFQLGGVADSGSFADNGAAPDEGALTDRRILINDAGTADIGAVKNSCALCHPDIFTSLLEPVGRKCGTDLADKTGDQRKNLPCIGGLCEQFRSNGLIQIKNFVICKISQLHIVLLFITSGYELVLVLLLREVSFPVLFSLPFPFFLLLPEAVLFDERVFFTEDFFSGYSAASF